MSKIVFSVLTVLLSFVMLFSFVRASFGVEVLTTKEFVTDVANISTDFSRTKENLQSLKDAFEKIEMPLWDQDFTITTQDDLRRQNGNVALFFLSQCTIKGDGTLVVPNGACYTSSEYKVTGDSVRIDLGFFGGYTLFDELIASVKKLLKEHDDSFLAGIFKGVLYINSFFGYLDSILTMLFELFFVGVALVKDTIFFVVDVILFLLKMLGIDATSKVPLYS